MFLLRVAQTEILLPTASHIAEMTSASHNTRLIDEDRVLLFAWSSLKHYPPSLSLWYSRDYRCEPLYPVIYFSLFRHVIKEFESELTTFYYLVSSLNIY
jgi:hypothetical protein